MKPHVLPGTLLIVLALLLLIGCDSTEPAFPEVSTLDPVAPAFFDYPAWHPGGRFIAAEHGDSLDTDQDGELDAAFGGMWLIDAETGEKKPLVAGGTLPAWSPDGKRLAMVHAAQIFTVAVDDVDEAHIDTSSLRQLTTQGRNFFPTWSADGQWIAYDSDVQDMSAPYEVWIMRADGSMKTAVTGYSSRMPDWSAPGSRIVFKDYSEQHGEISVLDTVSKAVERLTFDTRLDDYPRFSPDGKQIAYISSGGSSPSAIWLMNSDGTHARKVSPDQVYRFDWSPDGRQFVFLYHPGYKDPGTGELYPGSGELWLMNADGSGLRQLTRTAYK